MAGGALPRGREVAGKASRARGQVQGEEEVPAAQDHLGRGAEDALFQGEDPESAEGVVLAGSVPEPDQEAGTGPGDRADADTGRELVQEPAAEGPSCGGQK